MKFLLSSLLFTSILCAETNCDCEVYPPLSKEEAECSLELKIKETFETVVWEHRIAELFNLGRDERYAFFRKHMLNLLDEYDRLYH